MKSIAIESQNDVRGRSCLVTGGNDGIGFEIASALAAAGADVVIVARSEPRGRAAIAEITSRFPGAKVDLELADMSIQSSIHALAERWVASGRPLHVLVNNAGGWSSARRETVDGIEQTWATNMLGYFLLTKLLEPVLRASAPARVVVVASGLAKGLDLGDVEFKRRRYDGVKAYAQSKQANRIWTYALARRLAGSGVVANAMNPNQTRTSAFRKGGGISGWLAHYWIALVAKPASAGADTAVWLAAARDLEGVTGRYFEARREQPCDLHDVQRGDELWALCEHMTALRG